LLHILARLWPSRSYQLLSKMSTVQKKCRLIHPRHVQSPETGENKVSNQVRWRFRFHFPPPNQWPHIHPNASRITLFSAASAEKHFIRLHTERTALILCIPAINSSQGYYRPQSTKPLFVYIAFEKGTTSTTSRKSFHQGKFLGPVPGVDVLVLVPYPAGSATRFPRKAMDSSPQKLINVFLMVLLYDIL
jgi:hypothetical protein